MRIRHFRPIHAAAGLAVTLVIAYGAASSGTGNRPPAGLAAPDSVIPNDNRTAGGTLQDGVLVLELVAAVAGFRPDLNVDSMVTVHAFAERRGPPRVPGPLLRAVSGTRIRVRVHNDVPDSTLVLRGIRAGTVEDDSIVVPPGMERSVEFTAGAPGTYMYWGTTTSKATVADRNGRDGQLTGAIVIDPAGSAPDPDERIFVMTVIDIVPDTTLPESQREDIWELAINGRSWPDTERLEVGVGDTARWRWVNGSYLSHPMHLHGFHFRVMAKGDGTRDVIRAPGAVPDVVTEFMAPGSTFAMEWVPTRAGNWLFHCHMTPHITPFPERPDSLREHDHHDVMRHATDGMAGLVLGIRSVERGGRPSAAPPIPARNVRLVVQQVKGDSPRRLRPSGYVIQRDAEPAPDSVVVPGPPLVLTRGETTAITVVNRTTEATTVHWHGMELESVYDGVAGWSGVTGNIAPLLAPGDSFVVAFTPPRAGTFIYHTHMDELEQLATGMYGPLIVLEPGQQFDPDIDRIIILGRAVDNGANDLAVNGRREAPLMVLRAGTTYRLRIINMLPAAPSEVSLRNGDGLIAWTAVSKDGADLPPPLRVTGPAHIPRLGVGETYDFEWIPSRAMDAELVFDIPGQQLTLMQRIRVR